MFRLPFLFIMTGMAGFIVFHAASLLSLSTWFAGGLRGPSGWFHIHLFVLGWATMLAMGAVYQLISVILQSKIYSERLGYVHYVLFTSGLSGLLFGFWSGKPPLIAGFAILTLAGILLFSWNMAVTMFRASQWNAITISAACSVLYLLLTGLSGLVMGVNFFLGQWAELHARLFGAHIWLGSIGWFGLLITGFSYKMLPMFYLAHHFPIRLQSVTLLLWNVGVLTGASSFLFDGGFWSKWFALLLITAAVIVYTIHIGQIQKFRHKANPGLGIKWSVYGTQAFAVFSVFMLLYSLCFPQKLLDAKSVLLAGWIYLGGWVSFTILCYVSKIVPFLWWTHQYGNQVGKTGTPTMADLLDEKKVQAGLAAIALSFIILFAGLVLDQQLIMMIGGIAFSLLSLAYISMVGLVFTR